MTKHKKLCGLDKKGLENSSLFLLQQLFCYIPERICEGRGGGCFVAWQLKPPSQLWKLLQGTDERRGESAARLTVFLRAVSFDLRSTLDEWFETVSFYGICLCWSAGPSCFWC